MSAHLYLIQTEDLQGNLLPHVEMHATSPNGNWAGTTNACALFFPTLAEGAYAVDFFLNGRLVGHRDWNLADPPVNAIRVGLDRGMPAVPTREALCAVKMSFQGLEFDTPTYGHVFWWETIAWWPFQQDRQAAYAAKRAAGDTHIILDLSGSYKELGEEYDDVGADYSQNLPALVTLAEEAVREGFLIDLRLAGDGQGAGPGYNDPVGMTYGHDWLMANFPRIAEAFAHLVDYTVFVTGYDGVFYSWSPEQVMAFGALFRSIFPNGCLGIEFNTGHIPLGEGPGYQGAYAPGGCMQDYDVIYGEFDPFNYHADSTWQIVGRLVSPYTRPADQPSGDDPHPPFLLGTPNARGPWFFIAFEILTYTWVRGKCSQDDIRAYREYFAALGCPHIC